MRCNCSAGLLIRCYQACLCKVVTYKFLFSIAGGQTFSLHWLLFILAEFTCSPSGILERATCGSTLRTEGGLDVPWELCDVSLQSIQQGRRLGTSARLCLGMRCKYKLKYNLKYRFTGQKCKSAKKQRSEEQEVWSLRALHFTTPGEQSRSKEEESK